MALDARPSFDELPGADIVRQGVADLLAQRDTPSAALVLMARPRLSAAGIAVPRSDDRDQESPGHRLYGVLVAEDPSTAYSRYNALVARIASFAQAAEHAAAR